MDVSIAVSLIRGQMGTVVERAVNGAVETVLAEMLKVVGVKFEELKSQVALMKRDMETLQREKALKDKENDNMRAKLRYTELKLKYYRQGVEEELQQHVSAAALSHMCTPPAVQVTGQRPPGTSQSNAAPSCSGQTKTGTSSTSPQTSGRHGGKVHCQTDACASSNAADIMQTLMSTESLDNSTVLNHPSSGNDSEDQKVEWTVALQPNAREVSGVQLLSLKSEQQSTSSTTGSSSSEVSAHADSSTLPCSPSQMKQETQHDDEVIYIKEEPEEETDEAMYDCQAPDTKVSRNGTDWSGPQTSGINAAGTSSGAAFSLPGLCASMPSSVLSSSFSSFSQYPWHRRSFGLPEDYKKRIKEQQRRTWIKCRELENTPQPQLSEMLRERREKTRLRVAKWRAKKKLQEAKARAGAAAVSQALMPGGTQNQLLGANFVTVSGSQQNTAVHLQNTYLCSNLAAGHTQPSFMGMSSNSLLFPKAQAGGLGNGSGDGAGCSSLTSQTVTSSSSSYPQIHMTQQNTPLNHPEMIDLVGEKSLSFILERQQNTSVQFVTWPREDHLQEAPSSD